MAADGPYTVTVIANDGTYSAMQSFDWTVNDPITITAPSDQTNNEGDSRLAVNQCQPAAAPYRMPPGDCLLASRSTPAREQSRERSPSAQRTTGHTA